MPDRVAPAGTPFLGADDEPHPEVNWEAAENSPEFKELIKRRRAFVVPATIFFFVYYFGFIILCGYAPDFMGTFIGDSTLTIGYVIALTQFIMVWVLGGLYLRMSDRVFDPLAAKAAARAQQVAQDSSAAAAAERQRGAVAADPGKVVPQ
jgi:uncharacterized membrane protein (DUF485 family)